MHGMSRCVVCHDECVRAVRCRNYHAVCVGCEMGTADNRCPMCRATRSTQFDSTFELAYQIRMPAARPPLILDRRRVLAPAPPLILRVRIRPPAPPSPPVHRPTPSRPPPGTRVIVTF